MGKRDREVKTEGVRKVAMYLSWEVPFLKQEIREKAQVWSK